MRRLLLALAFVTGIASAMCSSTDDAPANDDIPLPDRVLADAGDEADAPAPRADAGTDAADAAVDVWAVCDKDQDGVFSVACDGGKDCDDDDQLAHPDAGFSRDAASPQTKGDWNCDGVVEKQQRINTSCAGADQATCSSRTGFSGDPPCGQTGPFVACAYVTNTCMTVAMPGGVVQACK